MAQFLSDPLFSEQWHLQNNVLGLLDLNVVDVWDDYTGAGVDVAIIDDGVQREHPDLVANYSTPKDWDFTGGDTNADGFNIDDNHGTAVAGIIGATAGNDIGGVGVAHGATIFGFRAIFFEELSNAINNASGLSSVDGLDHSADIVNMSIGNSPDVFFDQRLDLSSLNEAIDNAAIFGRDGLGTILVKSAGNDRGFNQDTNVSSWNANPRTISVAAVDQDGFVSDYSTHGASVLVTAFGTPGEVVTTDRVGRIGYTPFDSTSTFSGTSASAPMVSGVVALMLEANPNLGWRDVQEILVYSARHVGTDVGQGTTRFEEYAWDFNGATNWNGGGLHFSNDYGFGLVDAKAAVRLAETWSPVPQTSENAVTVSTDLLEASLTVEELGITLSRSVDTALKVEHVEVDIRFTRWDDLGDLSVRLISPDGTVSVLLDNSGENTNSAVGGLGTSRWQLYSNAFWGENTAGTWEIELFDIDSSVTSPVTVDDINITFHGQTASLDDTFIFTEEYSDYAGQFGHSTFIDGDIGVDTLNAAAVETSTFAQLQTGMAMIDGVRTTVTNVENIVTGDGNDFLIGDDFDNSLVGMRGQDNLHGLGGDDRLVGGTGNDELNGGLGNDYLNGSSYRGQGNGERDSLLSGSRDDQDVFVLGEEDRVFYNNLGNTDYALIGDFDLADPLDDLADTIQLVGSSLSYSISNVTVDGTMGAGIQFANDLIGLVAGVNAASLNLNDSTQFVYV
ncbi:MAG: S8 family serine peptidase [Cyanobacteria bacterium P01_H01_bin.26]